MDVDDERDLPELVRAAQQGDADAYAVIVRRFERMAQATGRAMLGDPARAADAAQDAFIEAFYQLDQLRDPAAFPGWFRRIVFKHCDRQFRRDHGEIALDDERGVDHGDGAPDMLSDLHMRERVRSALDALPARQRQVTKMFYLEGYSQREIVDTLAWPLPTVKKQLFQARQRLRAQLREEITLMDAKMDAKTYDPALPLRVRFFLALRARDAQAVRALAAAHPALLTELTEWAELEESYYWPTGYTALHYAIAVGDAALADTLIAAGADVNALTKYSFATPLHIAAMQRRAGLLATLLAAGANVGAANGNGQTALHFAAYRGDPDITRALLTAGANPQLKDAGGHTPVDWARHRGHAALAQQLAGRVVPAADAAPFTPARGAQLATGIKVIDLFAPFARGGVNGVFTPLSGVGKVVTLEQLIDTLARQYSGHTHFLGIEGPHFTGPDFAVEIRDVGLESACALHFVKSDDGPALSAALDRIAIDCDGGRELLIMLDAALVAHPGVQQRVEALARRAPDSAVTVVWFGEHSPGIEPEHFAHLAGVAGFDMWRALNGFWPAIDPLRSHAALPAGRHATLVARAQRLLRRYEDLRIIIERDPRGAGGLPADADRVDAARARQLHAFLAQPFPVAELWTGVYGELVPPAWALDGLEAVLDGRAAAVSEAALRTIAGTRLYIRR